jgi:hypothetical protein
MLPVSRESKGFQPESSSAAVSGDRFPNARHLRIAVTCLLVYFGVRLLFFATSISHAVPPDETTHFGLSEIFSKTLLFPGNSPQTYQFGLVTNVPWLYYWIMGRLLSLNFFGLSDLVFLRLCNIPLAFGTVYFTWRTLRLLTEDRLSQILLLVAMTNTLMFTFLSASVSYDNLTNLLAAMAIFFLLAFFRSHLAKLLAYSLLCQFAGCLAKITMLPLVLVLTLLLLMHCARQPRVVWGSVAQWFRGSGWRAASLTLALVVGLVFNLRLYGGNYLTYHSLTPSMTQVLSSATAMKNRLYARGEVVGLFAQGRLSKEQALAMTAQIPSEGERADAANMIENLDAVRTHKVELMGRLAYLPFWCLRMTAGGYGILAHLIMPNELAIIPFGLLLVLAGIGFAANWRPRREGLVAACLVAVAFFYALFLMYYVNYDEYVSTASPGAGLQGRYIFPVLGPIYALSSYYLLHLFRKWPLKMALFVAAASFFLAFDFPYFLAHVSTDWFSLTSG